MAVSEIEQIMTKYDIAGHVILTSPTHSEFRFFLTPTWSCAKWIKEGELRFISNSKEIGKDAAKVKTEQTCHMVFATKDLLSMAYMNYDNMTKAIQTQVVVNHTKAEIVPHTKDMEQGHSTS